MSIKKTLVISGLSLAALVAAAAMYAISFRPTPHFYSVEAQDSAAKATGLGDCFWAGVITKGSAINYAYPDTATTYWLTQFRLPEGARLEFEGEYPHARYMSYNIYDDKGQPVDRMLDEMLVPEAGSHNPFLPNADRTVTQRKYKMQVAQGDVEAGMPMSQIDPTRPQNTLYVPKGDTQVQLILRTYVEDKGLSPKGGMELPRPTMKLADGSTVQGEALCKAIVNKENLMRNFHSNPDRIQTLLDLKSSTTPYSPAQPVPKWFTFLNPPTTIAASLYGTKFEVLTNLLSKTRRGGFYSTLDNTYMLSYVDDRLGDVVVLQGKAPTTPKTYNGEPTMTPAQMRYWSVCKYRSLADATVDDTCVYDEQSSIDTNGNYNIVYSTPENRPANAREECGFTWRTWGVGDGIKNPHGGLLVFRHMSPNPDFKNSLFATKGGDEKEVLGPYYPQTAYQTKTEFEQRGCHKS